MNKFTKTRLIYIIVLLCLPVLFIFLDSRLDLGNRYISSLFFIIASFIVSMTIYNILLLIIHKHPMFLEKGFWANPFNMLIVGTFVLLIFVIVFVLTTNNLEMNPTLNKTVTFIMAYPVSFVLILMIDAFYKRMFADKEKRLFISSISVVLGLAIMILFGILSTR